MKLIGEQFALVVNSIDDFIASSQINLGLKNWVQDDVNALTIFDLDEDLHPRPYGDGSSFPALRYQIAFNYDLIPGMEFEIIHPISGWSVHKDVKNGGFGHIGYHLPDKDTFVAHIARLLEQGGTVVQICVTTKHSSSKRFYQYAYVRFPNVPVPFKIIQRLEKCFTISEAESLKHMYTSLWGKK